MAIFTDYLAAAIMYNIQILPETLMCGIIILGIILANPSIVTLAAAAGASQLLTSSVSRLMMKMMPDGAVVSSSSNMCQMGYIGKSWERLLRGSASDLLWHPKAPSLFMSTIGFFVGYGWALTQLYRDEINVGVMNKALPMGLNIVGALLVIIAGVFRYNTGCDSFISLFAGTFIGLLLGYIGATIIGHVSGRRLTNLWGIPLLRDRINGGASVYVCDAASSSSSSA